MEPEYSNKRKEVPFLIEVRATVKASKNGQTIRATTVNMSGCGVLLQFDEPVLLAVGDQVSCEFKVAHKADSPLPYWG
ncbi:MAG: PilZ domain-containing protein [Terriglobales bacterium]